MQWKPSSRGVAALFVAAASFPGLAASDSYVIVSVSVSGLGRVVSDPPGISCPDACSARFPAFSTVTLRAKPEKGGELLSWGGDCDSPTRSCRIYLDGEKLVQAGFSVGL